MRIVNRLAIASLLLVSLLTLLLFLSWIVLNLSFDGGYLWSAARLTPLVSLFYGYDLYYGSGDGPLLDTIYGPLAYLPFAPAALASTPTNVVLVGQVTAILIGLASIGALLLKEARRSRLPTWQTVCLGVCIFSLLAFFTPQSAAAFPGFLAFMAFGVHADAPALAFATLACVCIYGHRQMPTRLAMILCAAFATLAVWAKQTEVGIFVAIGLYLLLAFGRGALARFTVAALVVGSSISLLILMVFGARNSIFNMFIVPSRHPPWVPLGVGDNPVRIPEMITATWPIIVLAIVAVVLKLKYQRPFPRDGGSFSAGNPWVLLVFAALFSMPTSIMGVIKFGGLANSYHFAYYLAVLAALLFASLGGGSSEAGPDSRKYRPAVILPGFIVVLALIPASLPQLKWLRQGSRIYDNSLEQAYRYARKNPGTAFFPWMPLSTLLAEGTLYHYDYGIFDWQLAGFSPDVERFRSHIPGQVAYVFYPVTAPAPSPYQNDDPPAVQFLPECAYLGNGGPMMSFSANWRAWTCHRRG